MTIRQTRYFLIFVMIVMFALSLAQIALLVFSHGPRSSSLFIGSPLLFIVVFASQLKRLREREAVEGPDAPFTTSEQAARKRLVLVLAGLVAAGLAIVAAVLLRRHA